MAAKWGVFLCDCQRPQAIDLQRLDLPTPCVYRVRHPETDAHALVALAKRERLERVLIGCCAAPDVFDTSLNAAGTDAPQLDVVNLKASCFRVHPDPAQAHTNTSRLIRVAIRTAEVQSEAAYNPLRVGGRLLIATDMPQGWQLAEQLRDVGGAAAFRRGSGGVCCTCRLVLAHIPRPASQDTGSSG